jgi:hypothetical protein
VRIQRYCTRKGLVCEGFLDNHSPRNVLVRTYPHRWEDAPEDFKAAWLAQALATEKDPKLRDLLGAIQALERVRILTFTKSC